MTRERAILGELIKGKLQREGYLEENDAVKLDTLQSYGRDHISLKKIKDKVFLEDLNKYPNINGENLRNEIANFHNIESDQIILGCGSDETLLFAALSFCQSGDEIIHAEHGFEMYSIIAKVVGAVSKLAKEENYKISVKSICNEISPATKLI